jgi:hypothetical protein
MSALATAPSRRRYGSAEPRVSPPRPARSDLAAVRREAVALGIKLMPWQETAARYLTARGPDGLLYREVAILVARQQGKTTLAKPFIIHRLREGKRVIHIAQVRDLPREMFRAIADALSNEPELFPKRRGRVIWPRFGQGTEEIILANGGSYRIAAAGGGSARGRATDLVVIDELREMESNDVIAAAEPTTSMSPDPQIVYLSNAGTSASIVLNAVRDRAGEDPSLAYLEWSAAPDRDVDDREGWYEANPAIGHHPQVLRNLEASYRRHSLSGTLNHFETENLCRWVTSIQPSLVDEAAWLRCRTEPGPIRQPSMGIAMDPSGKRASAVIAWPIDDTRVGLEVVADVTGDPIDVALFGPDLRKLASSLKVRSVWFDPWTDADLARYLPGAKAMGSRDHGAASGKFATLVESGALRWSRAAEITADLPQTARDKAHDGGQWQAVRAKEGRPVTAALAAVRAVWLPSGPRHATPKVM